MKLERTTTERIDGYFYSYVETGDLGSNSPHHHIDARKRDYWQSYETGVREGDVRVIGGRDYVAMTVQPRRWRPSIVTWTLKR